LSVKARCRVIPCCWKRTRGTYQERRGCFAALVTKLLGIAQLSGIVDGGVHHHVTRRFLGRPRLVVVTDAPTNAVAETPERLRVDVHQLTRVFALIAMHRFTRAGLPLQTHTSCGAMHGRTPQSQHHGDAIWTPIALSPQLGEGRLVLEGRPPWRAMRSRTVDEAERSKLPIACPPAIVGAPRNANWWQAATTVVPLPTACSNARRPRAVRRAEA
jgi:hypothetical protein